MNLIPGLFDPALAWEYPGSEWEASGRNLLFAKTEFDKIFYMDYLQVASQTAARLHYQAGPIDFAKSNGTFITGFVTIQPLEAQLEIWEKAGLDPLDISLPASQQFITDYVNRLFMLSSDTVSFSFNNVTIGTGVELYIALACKFNKMYSDWNPDIHIAADPGDPLIRVLGQLGSLVSLYESDEEMFEAMKGCEPKLKKYPALFFDYMADELEKLAIREGKMFRRNNKVFFDLGGNGKTVEPYVLFTYAHELLKNSGFPGYQERNDIYVHAPHSVAEKKIEDRINQYGISYIYRPFTKALKAATVRFRDTESLALYVRRFTPNIISRANYYMEKKGIPGYVLNFFEFLAELPEKMYKSVHI